MARQVDGVALGAIGAGSIFIYAGLSGRSVLSTLQAIIKGDNPSNADAIHGGIVVGAQAAEAAAAISGGTVIGSATGAVTGAVGSALGARIAQDVKQYIGTGYAFGGAPAGDINRKDCSSLVNWVVGHDLGLAIPFYSPGAYTGHDHGPPTGAWLLWDGATTIGHSPSDAQPGDLCCWQTHMGIAIGGGQMVSARSARAKPPTGQGAIATGGPAGQPLFVRRLKAVQQAAAAEINAVRG